MSLCYKDWHALFVSVTQLILSVKLRNNSCVKLCTLAVFSNLTINIEFNFSYFHFYKILFLEENLSIYN